MLELLLNPTIVTTALIVLALATPAAAWAARRRIAASRMVILIGALGPVLLALWGLHNLVLETVGFASIWSALILLTLAVCGGVAAGWWLAGESGEQSKG